MEALMKHFTPLGHPCFAPDMPGFGGSFDPQTDPPAISWYIDLYANHVFPTMGLQPGGFHLIGHHSGGVIGLEMAVLHPTLLKSLVSIGPAVMTAEQRSEMRAKYVVPFNKPEPTGGHLLKTWEYLNGKSHNIPTSELDLLQRETIDHIRAWKGRLQIYNCVWNQDSETLLKQVQTPTLALCARDDVLWAYFEYFKNIRPDIETAEVTGGNFGPGRGAESIAAALEGWLGKQ
jgi:pimeloyl-ACP methyl ester carboxylesterase